MACESFVELPPKLPQVHAMLGHFALAQEDDGNVEVVASAQDGVGVYIDFAEGGACAAQQRSDLRLSFVTKMAAGARVQGYIERRGHGQVYRSPATRGGPGGLS